jgi:hypothetical protein
MHCRSSAAAYAYPEATKDIDIFRLRGRVRSRIIAVLHRVGNERMSLTAQLAGEFDSAILHRGADYLGSLSCD